MKGKRPAYQHYPGDEQRDTNVQLLTLAEFGLWRRMLNLMHDGEPYGHLTDASGRAIPAKDLARLVGEPVTAVTKHLKRLEDLKVFARRQSDGAIYSRRMVRDEHKRNVRAAGGPLSLDNPNVPRPKDHTKDGYKDTFDPSLGGSPAFAVCGLRSASASSDLAVGEIEHKRVLNTPARDSRSATDVAAPLRSLALNQLLDALDPRVRGFLETFYRQHARADLDRVRDVGLQLLALQRGEDVPDHRRQPVRAYSLDRLVLKCRQVQLAPPRDPNAAMAILLIKLGDTSDLAGSGALPGQVDAKAHAPDGPLDERVEALLAGVSAALPTLTKTSSE